MSENTNRTERFTVEGFFEGEWHLVMSSDERETAIRGAGSVVVSGAFEHVRIMLNGVVPGVGREMVRIDQHGTVRNGAFVEDIGAPSAPARQDQKIDRETRRCCTVGRRAGGCGAVFAVGLAVGNWAVQMI